MTAAELEEKYRRCASGPLDGDEVDKSLDRLRSINRLDDIGSLLDVLE